MKWLHISDIHFNIEGYDTSNLRERLKKYLSDNKIRVDFILVTGDCMYKYSGDNIKMKEICDFIKSIAKLCKCPNKRIFLCQGNHDVNRNDERRNKIISKLRRKNTKDADFTSYYNMLCELEMGKFGGLHKTVTSYDYESYKMFSPKGENYRIISLNTCLLSKDKSDYQKLKLCNSKLNEIGKAIPIDNKLNIVMMHHGIEYLTIEDSVKFEHWVEDHNIDIVVCGHSHRAAVETYDNTKTEIKQFTAGAVVMDDYAIPSFYICEYDENNTYIIMRLITYSKQNEKWVLDNQHTRKFENGTYIYELRKTNKNEKSNLDFDDINICKTTIDRLNKKYQIRYNSESVYSNKFEGYEKFDAWKIVHSLVETGISYNRAFDITKSVVEEITCADFKYNDMENSLISSRDIRNIVYKNIINYKGEKDDSEFEISCWASRYGRKYGKGNETIVLKSYNEIERLTYSYVKNKLLKEVVDEVTGNTVFYEKIFRNELTKMTEGLFGMINKMGLSEIRHSVLKEITREYITQKPHPWLVNSNRQDLVLYHKQQGEVHIKELETNEHYSLLTQMEAAYHTCAALLAQYNDYLGCSETSPINILSMSINHITDKYSNDMPMQKFQLIQLKKDLESCNITFNDFSACIDVIEKKIVNEKRVKNEEARRATLNLWGMLKKLEQKALLLEADQTLSSVETLSRIFNSGNGFVVKAELRGLKECFWVEPNWENYESLPYHLGKQFLVCLLKKCDDKKIEDIINYLYVQKSREGFSEIIFVYENLFPFSSEERKNIRGKFKSKYCRCVFIQNENIANISNERNWREILFEVIGRSRIS